MEAKKNNYGTNEYIGGSTARKLQDYIGEGNIPGRRYKTAENGSISAAYTGENGSRRYRTETGSAAPDIRYEPARKQAAPDRYREAERRIAEREARRRAQEEAERREKRRAQEAEEQRRNEAEAQRNPGKQLSPHVATDIGLGRMILLVAAIAVTLYVCFGYLQVQADIVVANKAIKNLESRLSDIKTRNESAYNAVIQGVDFDEVYKVAVGELGMVFPNKNTVLSYTPNKTGYVRQYADIPEIDRLAALRELLPLD
jgi:cell division protein FtsL